MLKGGSIPEMALDEVIQLLTVAQSIADHCVNEVERRGVFEWHQGTPIVPYCCDYSEPTILTRGDPDTFESNPQNWKGSYYRGAPLTKGLARGLPQLADFHHRPREGDIANDANGDQQASLPPIKVKVHPRSPNLFATPVTRASSLEAIRI
jgi:hypothetical protein